MELKIENKEKSKVVLEYTMSKEEFNERLDKAYVKNNKYFKVPGFRAGKVPRNVIEKVYGEGALYETVINDVADLEYKKTLEENNFEIVSQPKLDVKQIGKDQDLIFTVEFFVKPEATVKQYKGLEIEKTVVEVTDEDVTTFIDDVRNKNARVITVDDRELASGDIANIDFEGFLDGIPFEGGKGEKFDLTIGSGQFIPGFEEQLVGMKLEETREINVTFPENYNSTELAGKATTFKVKLNNIQVKELPELDNEFAKDVSEFETLEEYKASVKAKLLEDKTRQAGFEKETKVIDKLIENVEVEIPEEMIEEQVTENMKAFESNLMQQGFTIEKYVEMLNTTMEDIKSNFKPGAIKDIKLKLALEFIGKEEIIEITKEDIDSKIEELSKSYGNEQTNIDSLKNNENIRKYMNEKLVQEKLIDLIVTSAIEK